MRPSSGPLVSEMHVKFEKNGDKEIDIELFAEANIPTKHGKIKVLVFHTNIDSMEHLAIQVGDTHCAEPVPVRMHSECFTSEVLGSLKCDCREQFEASWEYISAQGCGLIIYLRQEGRGIGLGNKIKAYKLQEEGLDTIEANLHLGFSDDHRNYDIAAAILKYLGVNKIMLLTNNPDKIENLERDGIEIVGRIPIEIPANEFSYGYLKTKRDKAGHLLEHLEDFSCEKREE
jgi:GTP cyclohydrolase II